jgi:hypothetical protein
MVFSSMAVVIMNTEGDASGAQGSGQPRRSPRVALQGQQQLNTYKRKDRKKRLRLPTPQPDVDSEVHEEQEGQDNEQRAQDSDFDPARDAEGGGDDDTGADGDAANVVGQKRRRKQPPAIRCSPSKFQELLKALPADLEARVRANGFGGLLGFKPSYLDRKLLTWLMLRLNPETMKLELGGGKEIAITEHTIWCVFQLPKAGGDPAFMSDAEARIRRNELGEQICPSTYKRLGIRIMDIVDELKSKTLTGDLGLRAFFMGVFHSLLFSNTDSRIRLEDVIYTEDLANIGKINWCKAVVDNLSKAARLYRKDFATKGVDAPITGCGIFLMVSFFAFIGFLLH